MSLYDDNFTGVDGNPPDPTKWMLKVGTPDILTNRLRLIADESEEAQSLWYITGNFDIQVDVDVAGGPAANSWGLYLKAYIDDTHQIYISACRYGDDNHYQRGVINGGSWSYTGANRSLTSTKLRIVRNSASFTVYYWNGSNWVAISTAVTVGSTGNRCFITLSAARWDTNPSFTGYEDNFLINSGTPELNEAILIEAVSVSTVDNFVIPPVVLNKAVSVAISEMFFEADAGVIPAASITIADQFVGELLPAYLDESWSATLADNLVAGLIPQVDTGLPQLIASNQPRIDGGAAITAKGDAIDQAVYWELVSYNPETDQEGVAMGSLLFARTKTDGAMLSKNYYFAPTNPALAGKTDRVKATIAHA